MVPFNSPKNTVAGESDLTPFFTEEETKAHKSQIICPKSNKLKSDGIRI